MKPLPRQGDIPLLINNAGNGYGVVINRKKRDGAAADRIRQELAAAGIEVTDTPAGPRWRRLG